MFQQCARDAAPGSSQTAFGSGSLFLAPLSNFRAGTLPTTVSLPHSHKPETDSLPACLAACSPSQSLFCLSTSLCLSALCRSITLSLLLPAFCLLSLPVLSFLSLTASKSCCTLPPSLVSSLPLSLLVSVCISLVLTVG